MVSSMSRHHSTHPKVELTRVREAAKRQGMLLEKSKKRDTNHLLYGRYWLYRLMVRRDSEGKPVGEMIFRWGGASGFPSLAKVEEFLKLGPRKRIQEGREYTDAGEDMYYKLVSLSASIHSRV
jgi:hypothetical protein